MRAKTPLTQQMTRSPQLFAHFGRIWYGDALQLKGRLPHTIYVERSLLSNHPADRQLRAVLSEISSRLAIDVQTVSIEEVWSRTEPGTLREALVKCSDVTGARMWVGFAADVAYSSGHRQPAAVSLSRARAHRRVSAAERRPNALHWSCDTPPLAAKNADHARGRAAS